MSTVNIRRLRDDEHEAAAQFLARCQRETFQSLIPAAAMRALIVERAWRRIAESPQSTYVIEKDGAIIALGRWHDDEITFLYVGAKYQRQGLGNRLLTHLLAEARAAGHSSPWLICLERNMAARAFYARMGGRETGDEPVVLNGVSLPHVRVVFDTSSP